MLLGSEEGKKNCHSGLDIILPARNSLHALVSSSAKCDQHLSQVIVRMIKSDGKHSVMIIIIII